MCVFVSVPVCVRDRERETVCVCVLCGVLCITLTEKSKATMMKSTAITEMHRVLIVPSTTAVTALLSMQ